MLELVDTICQSQIIEKEGIKIAPAMSIDKQGKKSLYAFDIGAGQIINWAFTFCANIEVQSFFIAFDTYTKPDQGTELDSALLIFCVERKNGQIGVMEYSWNKGSSITKPTCWNNSYWQATCSDLLKRMVEKNSWES